MTLLGARDGYPNANHDRDRDSDGMDAYLIASRFFLFSTCAARDSTGDASPRSDCIAGAFV